MLFVEDGYPIPCQQQSQARIQACAKGVQRTYCQETPLSPFLALLFFFSVPKGPYGQKKRGPRPYLCGPLFFDHLNPFLNLISFFSVPKGPYGQKKQVSNPTLPDLFFRSPGFQTESDNEYFAYVLKGPQRWREKRAHQSLKNFGFPHVPAQEFKSFRFPAPVYSRTPIHTHYHTSVHLYLYTPWNIKGSLFLERETKGRSYGSVCSCFPE